MLKRKHNLIIVSVIFVLLLGVLFLLISLPNSSDENKPENENVQTFDSIVNMSDKKISSIVVQNSSGTYKVEVKTAEDKEVYTISGKPDDKVSQSLVKVLLEDIINLKPIQIVSEDDKDLSVYGLDKSEANIVITFDNGEEVKLIIGNDAPLSKGSYMMKENESKIYLISPTDKEMFFNDENFYIEKE